MLGEGNYGPQPRRRRHAKHTLPQARKAQRTKGNGPPQAAGRRRRGTRLTPAPRLRRAKRVKRSPPRVRQAERSSASRMRQARMFAKHPLPGARKARRTKGDGGCPLGAARRAPRYRPPLFRRRHRNAGAGEQSIRRPPMPRRPDAALDRRRRQPPYERSRAAARRPGASEANGRLHSKE